MSPGFPEPLGRGEECCPDKGREASWARLPVSLVLSWQLLPHSSGPLATKGVLGLAGKESSPLSSYTRRGIPVTLCMGVSGSFDAVRMTPPLIQGWNEPIWLPSLAVLEVRKYQVQVIFLLGGRDIGWPAPVLFLHSRDPKPVYLLLLSFF